MTRKDQMELHYWKTTQHRDYHRNKAGLYLWALGHYNAPKSALEIGPGPFHGVLPHLVSTPIKVAVEPLIGDYIGAELAWPASGIHFCGMTFEEFETDQRFDAIFAIDSLDHGEMGFHLVPKIAGLLSPGGRFYLHAHLRPPELLNAIHDHDLKLADLHAALDASGPWDVLREDIYPEDVSGDFKCPAIVAVYEKR